MIVITFPESEKAIIFPVPPVKLIFPVVTIFPPLANKPIFPVPPVKLIFPVPITRLAPEYTPTPFSEVPPKLNSWLAIVWGISP